MLLKIYFLFVLDILLKLLENICNFSFFFRMLIEVIFDFFIVFLVFLMGW